MSQRPQPDHKSTQPNVLPAAPTNTQEETQGFQSIRHSRRVSIQEPLPIIHNRRVSIQEPLPTIHNRRVSIQEPLPIIHNRRVSIQEPLPTIHNRRVSIQEPLIVTSHWASTHDTPSVINSRQVSIENAPATISGHQASIQGAPSVTYSRRFNTRDVPPIFQTPYINTQNSPSITHTPLSNMESVIYNSSRASSNNSWPTSWSPHLSIQGLTLPNQARVNVPPSITHSPTVSVKSVDSVIWTSQEIFKDSVNSSQFYQNPLDNIQSTQTSISTEMDSGGFQNKGRRRHSQLPLAWKLLHGAKKISRQMSLALTLAGMVIISLISLGQPWMHFQVPLTPPGHPDGSLTIHINTIFFMQCPDIYCIQEYDQNAYLLDFAWAFLILASIASFFLCIILINIIFFTSSNLRMLDFSNVIISILAGMALRFFPSAHHDTQSPPHHILYSNPFPILTLIPYPNPCPSKSPIHPNKKCEFPIQPHLQPQYQLPLRLPSLSPTNLKLIHFPFWNVHPHPKLLSNSMYFSILKPSLLPSLTPPNLNLQLNPIPNHP